MSLAKGLLVLFIVGGFYAPDLRADDSPSPKQRVFIENKGQWDKEIKFRAELSNGFVFFTRTSIAYLLQEDNPQHSSHGRHDTPLHGCAANKSKKDGRAHAVKITFKGADLGKAKLRGVNRGSEYYNYLIGDRRNWATGVRHFEVLVYDDVYPGVSIKYYLSGGNLKYDLLVSPQAKTSKIAFEYDGQDSLKLEEGNLHVFNTIQDIKEEKPLSYQYIKGIRTEVPSGFELRDNIVSFQFPEGYDRKHTLIIDPRLVFSTFSGVTADNWGFTACPDNKSQTYSGGIASIAFGGTIIPQPGAFQQWFGGGRWDVAIFKYDSTGRNLLYGTFIGGNGNEMPHSLVVNSRNELLILGSTASTDFPLSANALGKTFMGGDSIMPIDGIPYTRGSDLFITRLSEDGKEVLASTYLGGVGNEGISTISNVRDTLVKNYGDEVRGDIITDELNNVYVASSTMSRDFPFVNALFPNHSGGRRDAIVFKLNDDLSEMLWGTYLGGTQEDAAYSIKLDRNNAVLAAGTTNSTDFPTTPNGLHPTHIGQIDGFVSYLSPDGDVLEASTFVGTDLDDVVFFCDFDSNEDVYLFGQSKGKYAVSPRVYTNPNSNQFIHKLSNNLGQTLFSTVVGSRRGAIDISPTAFLVNECDNLYIAGWGSSEKKFDYDKNGMNLRNLPITNNAFQRVTNGSGFYLAVFTANMEKLLYATYMGGTVAAAHVDGGTSRFDKRGVVYQAVCSCAGAADDFPTSPNAWSRTNNAFPNILSPRIQNPRCNNVVFKFDLATLLADFTTNTEEGTKPGITRFCMGEPILLLNNSSGGETFEWDLGDETVIVKNDSVLHAYNSPGIYEIVLKAEDENTCRSVDFARKSIIVSDENVQIMADASICYGSSIQLSATGAVSYEWREEDNDGILIGDNPVVQPKEDKRYHMDATTSNGCVVSDMVSIMVRPSHTIDFEVEKKVSCTGYPSFVFTNKSTVEDGLQWDFGDNYQTAEPNTTHQYRQPGEYQVTLSHTDPECSPRKTVSLINDELFVPNVFSPNTDPYNEFFVINGGSSNMELTVVDRTGKPVYHSDDYQNNWNANGLAAGSYFYHLKLQSGSQCKGWVQVLK